MLKELAEATGVLLWDREKLEEMLTTAATWLGAGGRNTSTAQQKSPRQEVWGLTTGPAGPIMNIERALPVSGWPPMLCYRS